MRPTTTLVLSFLLISAGATDGAELVLRAQCETTGAVVTLGDLAEIAAADRAEAERLAGIELFPAPATGRQQFVRQREIQDLLFLRGINLARHRFSGASQVTVGRAAAASEPTGERPLPATVHRRAADRLRRVIAEHLNRAVGTTEPWNIELELDDQLAKLVAAADGDLIVHGGQTPWVGNQRFEVALPASSEPAGVVALDARVALPPAVIVAAHSVPRGVVLCAADVEMRRDAVCSADAAVFQSIDEVVGQETTRAMGAGMVIGHDAVRSPLLVRRGEVITVTATAGGVRVRTNGRAKADASLGELVAVESIQDRTTYFARVCGLREAEVYAGPVRTRPTENAVSTPRESRIQP